MDPASLILGCIALLGPLSHCGKEIHKAVKRIKSSRRDICDLADETIIFTGLCEEYLRACADEGGTNAAKSVPIRSLTNWVERTSKGLKELLKKVQALTRESKSHSSLEEILIARLEWLCSRSLVDYLKKNMAVARESIKGFSNLLLIQKLNEELRWLKIALKEPSRRQEIEERFKMRIEEKMELIEQAIHIKTNVHRANARQLKVAHNDIPTKQPRSNVVEHLPLPSELFQFTACLDTYADEVLPSRQSDRASTRTRSHASRRSSTSTRTPETNIKVGSSISSVSSNSERTSNLVPSSMSSNVAIPQDIPESTPSQKHNDEPSSPIQVSSQTVLPSDRRAREYINDPEGTILSPPKVKQQEAIISPWKEQRIGQHTLALTPAGIVVNGITLFMDDYDLGLGFYQALLRHADKLDDLDHALRRGDQNWGGIPVWVVRPSDESVQSEAGDIRDV